jgi:cardiolipin synthase
MERDPKKAMHQRVSPLRALAERLFSRAAGADLVPGNSIRLLKDAAENYPAWLEAIRSARQWIHFETYVIHNDDAGQEFAEALCAKAREGVKVRLIYDWLGAFRKTSRRFWQHLREAGVEVRCFNPPRFESPLGWITRDHRKMLSVDGRVAFVTGLCVGRMWVGNAARKLDPWRDTGIELRGPAVADVDMAFAQAWEATGPSLPADEIPGRETISPAGDVRLRVIASVPNTAGLYRLDHLIAAMARSSLWLTDAYFVGITPYVQALRAAAQDGVDVRLLVPGSTDIPVLRAVSRAGYQPLLEAGVRVFEWNGSMIHAKTAVADGRWARVGSTNLNIASWMGNYELDVAVENDPFGRAMEERYLDDLEHATEIVLGRKQRVVPAGRRRRPRRVKTGGGSVSRAGASAIRIGNTVGAAFTNHRVLGLAEARITNVAGLALVVFALIALFFPRWVAVPLALFSGWLGVSLFVRAVRLRSKRRREMEGPGNEADRKASGESGAVSRNKITQSGGTRGGT